MRSNPYRRHSVFWLTCSMYKDCSGGKANPISRKCFLGGHGARNPQRATKREKNQRRKAAKHDDQNRKPCKDHAMLSLKHVANTIQYIYTYMHAHMYICTWTYIYSFIHCYIYIHIHTLHIYMDIMHILQPHILHIASCTLAYAAMHTHTHTHTYTHTHIYYYILLLHSQVVYKL